MAPILSRADYHERFARDVASWPQGGRERELWASRADVDVTADLLRSWSEAPGVSAFVFLDGAAPCAYAELWEDREAGEAELAHILVAPSHRRRGVAQAVLASLVAEAHARGFEDVWLRVVPWNEPAIACYLRAGFARTSSGREAAFNVGQPHAYVWMRAGKDAV